MLYQIKGAEQEVVCMQLSTLNFGTALVYWIDFGFNSTGNQASYAWRVPCILQCIFLFPMILLITLIPETPRWLAAHDRSSEALAVLRRIRGGSDDEEVIVDLHRGIITTVIWEKEIGAGSWKDLIKSDKIKSQRRFFTACAIQIFQQLGGINAIICKSIDLPPDEVQGTSVEIDSLSPKITRLLSSKTA